MDGVLNGSAAHDYVLLCGDFKQYVILDRVGASLELNPHLIGGSGRPTGSRRNYQHCR